MAEDHLVQADRHIAEAEDRIARQAELVTRLIDQGHDTANAEALLATLKDSLAAMHEHRQLILADRTMP